MGPLFAVKGRVFLDAMQGVSEEDFSRAHAVRAKEESLSQLSRVASGKQMSIEEVVRGVRGALSLLVA